MFVAPTDTELLMLMRQMLQTRFKTTVVFLCCHYFHIILIKEIFNATATAFWLTSVVF